MIAIANGLGIVFDRDCKSVSFGQGGGRALIATCFADGSGALPGPVAGLGIGMLGVIIMVGAAVRT